MTIEKRKALLEWRSYPIRLAPCAALAACWGAIDHPAVMPNELVYLIDPIIEQKMALP